MTTFVFKKAPQPLADISFLDAEGEPVSLKDWRGKVVLLNLWATWCAPCREEMPSLDRLQRDIGSDDFEVVALAVDKAGVKGAGKFFQDIKIENLKLFADPTARVSSSLRVVGMPTTILIDKQGREIGRLVGPADWDGEDAKRLIAASLGAGGSSEN
jgi:thiol-disulfide isomerase/thioredoxin